jgi:hypothetical protein
VLDFCARICISLLLKASRTAGIKNESKLEASRTGITIFVFVNFFDFKKIINGNKNAVDRCERNEAVKERVNFLPVKLIASINSEIESACLMAFPYIVSRIDDDAINKIKRADFS